MTNRRRFTFVAVIVMLGCGVGYVANRITHRGEGPRHSYPLSGNDVLTDEQAIALARQTLQLDGRYSERMQQVVFGNNSFVNRGEDKSYASLCWQEPGTNRQSYVQLYRTQGRVDAVSYPGK